MFIYASRIRRLRKEQSLTLGYEQKINLLQTQALQAMVNPHFIFNSLSAIQQQISVGNSDKAGSYLSRFAKLLRMNLETINENYISLSKELERINLYLESEKMRLEEKLDYTVVIGKNLQTEAILIPSMILQPLIENAIWHGLMPKGSGIVKIEIEGLMDFLSIQIVDNGIGINQSQKNVTKNNGRSHFGLSITRERLSILEKKLGKPVNFSITDLSSEGLSGTRVSILLPYITEH
jgi:sensor histidine kinase YesM